MLDQETLGFFQIISDVFAFPEPVTLSLIQNIAVGSAFSPQSRNDFLGLAGWNDFIRASLENDDWI